MTYVASRSGLAPKRQKKEMDPEMMKALTKKAAIKDEEEDIMAKERQEAGLGFAP